MRRRAVLRLTFFCPLLALAAVSCARVNMDTPPGFARFHRSPTCAAVSPEGMVFRVRMVRNYPRKSLSFWKEALKEHLLDEGYGLLNEGGEFESPEGRGAYFEWVVPYQGSAYIYLTAVILAGRKILIAECGGEYGLYTSYQDSLRESLSTIALRRRLF